MQVFNIGRLTFICTVDKKDEITWHAKVINLVKTPDSDSEERDFSASGYSKKEAVEKLQEQLQKEFLFSTSNLSFKDLIISLFRWFLAGGKTIIIVYRGLILLVILSFLSMFFIDFSGESSNTVSRNLSLIFSQKREALPDTGFFNESFIKSALKRSQNFFWASGVSFRNIRTGNREELIDLLDRNVEMKLVLLDPDSPLAEDTMIRQFSRTARRDDIVATMDALCKTPDGILTMHGNSKHQLLLSPMAPIIPMLRVDDSIFVSFLVHTDLQRKENMYDGPYLKFHINSKLGGMLYQNFNNMVAASATKRIYPR